MGNISIYTPVLELIRLVESQEGTLGVLRYGKQHIIACTLELTDNENAANISSIPAQQYQCRRVTTPTHGNTFEVTNVPGRTNILFHKGNTSEDTAGCILLGQYFGKLGEHRAVLNSGTTYKKFMSLVAPFDLLHLTIHEHF